MKVIELKGRFPALETLLESAQDEDVLFMRAGHPVARLERFTEEDWEDWLFEHDPEAIQGAQEARERFGRGEGVSFEEVLRELGVGVSELSEEGESGRR